MFFTFRRGWFSLTHPAVQVWMWVTYSTLGLLSLATFTFGIKDLLAWISKALRFDSSRRFFLRQSTHWSTVGLAAAGGLVGTHQAFTGLKIKDVQIPLETLPPDHPPLHIVQLTDLHIGAFLHKRFVESIVEKTNALMPDLIAITGDSVDGSVHDIQSEVEPLKNLRARYGVFFVPGNHEYYWNANEWNLLYERFGMHVLLNQHTVIQHAGAKILIGGVTDYRAHRFDENQRCDPRRSLEAAPACDAKILLAHQPRSCFEAARAGYDVQLSGHTHGGQYFPANILVHLFEPYVSGLYRHENMWLYVSQGTGYWGPPLRLGVPAEITSLRIFNPKRALS